MGENKFRSMENGPLPLASGDNNGLLISEGEDPRKSVITRRSGVLEHLLNDFDLVAAGVTLGSGDFIPIDINSDMSC